MIGVSSTPFADEQNLFRRCRIDHPNVVKLQELLQTATYICMILDLCDIDLDKCVANMFFFPTFPEARGLMRQLAQGESMFRGSEIAVCEHVNV